MALIRSIMEQMAETASGRPTKIQASEGDFRVEITLRDSDRLGCLLENLDFEWTQCGPRGIDVAQIENRITYLGEALQILESEGGKGKTILRSSPPRIEKEETSFFEMILNPARGFSLTRYKFHPKTGERIRVPAPLTHDTLTRLVRDLIEVAIKGTSPPI